MGFIKITTISESGVTTKDLSELTKDERLDLELDILTNAKVTLLCNKCYKPIPVGTGNACDIHKKNN